MVMQDWRVSEAYTYLSTLDMTEFAFEFLRRHPDYRRDFRSATDHAGEGPGDRADAELASHWGLSSFRRSRS